MVTDKECYEYARDCVRLARLTPDKEIRAQLMKMARAWMAEARHEEPSEVIGPKPKSAA